MDELLKIHVDCVPVSLDGLDTETYSQWTVVYNTADRLFEYGAKGELQPSLAETASVSDDGLEWRFRIRADRRFHDGTPVTAEDAAYSLALAVASPKSYSHLNEVVAPDGVRVVDDRTIAVRLKHPYPQLLEALNYNENAIRSRVAHLAGKLVYSGAWRVEGQSETHVDLARNDEHPAAAQAFSRIRVERVPANVAHYRGLLEAGRSVIIGRGALSFTSRFKSHTKWATYVFAAGNTYVLILRPGLAHADWVKHAMRAVFREKGVLDAYPYLRESSSFYPKGTALYEPVQLNQPKPPPGLLPLELKVTRGLLFPELMQTMRGKARELGLALEFHEVDEAFRPGFTDADASDAFIAACYIDAQEPLHIAKAYFTGARSLVGDLPAPLAALLTRAELATRKADRAAFLRQFYDLLFKQQSALPLFFAPNAVLHSADVDTSAVDFYANTIPFHAFRPLPAEATEARAESDDAQLDSKMLAHDIRKPFSLVKTLLGLVKSVDDPARLKGLLESFVPEVERATGAVDAMIKDVLRKDSSALGELTIESPRALVTEAVRDAVRAADARAVELVYDFRNEAKVEIDRPKIARVLGNLVTNAIQAMSGQGRLWVRLADVVTQDGGFVEFKVGNTNSYIAPDDLQNLFKPWFTKGKKEGTGLGLTIVQRFIKAHGGTIVARSDRTEGTEFTFTLPLAPATRDEVVSGPGTHKVCPEPESGHTLWVPKVLLVEDNAFLLEAWQEMAGESLRAFDCPRALRDALAADPALLDGFDGLITDYYFDNEPSTNGVDFARWLKAQGFKKPIVLCSDLAEPGQELTEFVRVIGKDPVGPAELARLLTEPG